VYGVSLRGGKNALELDCGDNCTILDYIKTHGLCTLSG
jgi:hypothetical protein